MNSLSWFIYLTQLSDSLREGAGVLAVVLGTFLLVGGIFFFVALAVEGEQPPAQIAKLMRVGTFIFCSCLALAVFLPSRQTMLLIAGSEIGERFVQSKTVTDIVDPSVDLLKSWIREETKKLNKEKS